MKEADNEKKAQQLKNKKQLLVDEIEETGCGRKNRR